MAAIRHHIAPLHRDDRCSRAGALGQRDS